MTDTGKVLAVYVFDGKPSARMQRLIAHYYLGERLSFADRLFWFAMRLNPIWRIKRYISQRHLEIAELEERAS